MKIKPEWECIFPTKKRKDGSTYKVDWTERMKVFGGWLIRENIGENGDCGNVSVSVSTTFIPDPNHEWELDHED